KLIWKLDTNPKDVVDPDKKNTLQGTPVFHGGLIYIGNGHTVDWHFSPTSSGVFCIDPAKKGDISAELADGKGKAKPNPNSGVVWSYYGPDPKNKKRFRGTMSTVAVSASLVIVPETSGFVHCLDAKT